MKKVLTFLALLAIPFVLMAQKEFHDARIHMATGHIKSITASVMGTSRVITFTHDGKMMQEGMSNPIYDAKGYLQSMSFSVEGMPSTVKYKWENGRVTSSVLNVMGTIITTKHTYDEKGANIMDVLIMKEQEIQTQYSDYKYDERGNWISRKAYMAGQTIENTRKIEYYK